MWNARTYRMSFHLTTTSAMVYGCVATRAGEGEQVDLGQHVGLGQTRGPRGPTQTPSLPTSRVPCLLATLAQQLLLEQPCASGAAHLTTRALSVAPNLTARSGQAMPSFCQTSQCTTPTPCSPPHRLNKMAYALIMSSSRHGRGPSSSPASARSRS